MFITALLIFTKSWKQPKQPSSREWVSKLWYICPVEYYSAATRSSAAITHGVTTVAQKHHAE